METDLYILAALAVAAFMLLLLPLEIGVRYAREGKNDLLILDLFLRPLFQLKRRVVMIKARTGVKKSVLKYRGAGGKGDNSRSGRVKRIIAPGIGDLAGQFFFWREIFGLARPWIRYFLKRASIADLDWNTRLGLGDPFRTGMASGMAWSVKGSLLSLICSIVKPVKSPQIAVIPCFDGYCFEVRLNFRLATRTIYLALAGLGMAASIVKNRRSGDIYRMAKKSFALTRVRRPG